MKTFAPKLAIVLFSLVVPALAGGWTCAGRNFEGDEVRAQAEHWAREGIDKVSDFVNDEGGQLYYFEVGRETQLTESCTGCRAYTNKSGKIYNLRFLDYDDGQWKLCTPY
ncbi:BgTH12-00016 [Blumeria graminis f. sp. triticale]|uniref:BgtE-5922 n=3 Tax=Blumeria graminis TaxID=34373 RepID=A0A9X9MLC5_BLUGR|nr:BgTH12-00016 [Blumeria graminis f. sp. triticale]VDB92429.1 BgtE-5922 [Blumeria graminis f. sp. tritici]